jgi:GntR family transcriptional regulator
MHDLDKGVVDHESYIPLYIQLKEILQDYIDQKVWQPGDQLPSEPELCKKYGISRTVVRQALQEMQRDGVIFRRKGKGTFVAEPKFKESHIQKLTGFYQDMVERGYHVVSKVLDQQVIPADSKIARYLELELETPVVRTTRLRFVNDEPINLVTAYVPHEYCPELVNADLTNQSLYAFLECQCGMVIVRGRRTIEAVQATEDEAQLLEVETNGPLILVNGVSYVQDNSPIEYYYGLHRCDRSRFEVELVRVREWGNADDLRSMGDLPSSN